MLDPVETGRCISSLDFFCICGTMGASFPEGAIRMSKTYIPQDYRPLLDAYDTQRAIAYI